LLSTCEQALGIDHPHTAIVRGNLEKLRSQIASQPKNQESDPCGNGKADRPPEADSENLG